MDGKQTEAWFKHMDYIQATINRMAANSATQKNYCITLTTAIAGLAVVTGADDLVYIAIAAVTIFGILDAKYLQTEKGFRKLYDELRQTNSRHTDFRMLPLKSPFYKALVSWAIWPYYSAFIIGLIILDWEVL